MSYAAIDITEDDLILEPFGGAPAADLSDVWAIVDTPTPYVWGVNYSPVHFSHVLSAAAYYAAAPDRERFATVRKIGRAVRNLTGALAWGLSYRLQRFAESVDRRQLADLS